MTESEKYQRLLAFVKEIAHRESFTSMEQFSKFYAYVDYTAEKLLDEIGED